VGKNGQKEGTLIIIPFFNSICWFPGEGQRLLPNDRSQGLPSRLLHHKAEEPQAILIIEKHKVTFLINTGARILAIPFSPGSRSSKKITVSGHIKPTPRALFHSACNLLLGRFPFLSLLFNYPRNPYSSAGEAFYLNLGYSSFYPQESTFSCP
jgi:hypothetical protein